MLYKKKWPLILFVVPSVLFLILFIYVPFISNIKNSFFDMNAIVELPNQPFKFIGIENYKTLIKDATMGTAVINSFIIMALTIVFQVGIAFVLAVLVNSIRKGQQFFRTVYFFPIVISATALGLLFKLFYARDGGMLNQLLALFGAEPVNWLQPSTALIMIMIPTLWSYVGFYFVIMLTGLADISEDVYEAASIDGCSKFKQVFYITIPLLRGVVATCVTLAVTGALKVFDLPWVIAQHGAPNKMTFFLGTYMYEQAWELNNWDYASAVAIVIVILGIVVSRVVSGIVKPDKNL